MIPFAAETRAASDSPSPAIVASVSTARARYAFSKSCADASPDVIRSGIAGARGFGLRPAPGRLPPCFFAFDFLGVFKFSTPVMPNFIDHFEFAISKMAHNGPLPPEAVTRGLILLAFYTP